MFLELVGYNYYIIVYGGEEAMAETVRLEDWQKLVEDTYNSMPASCRPKKGIHKTRSYEKKRAMAISCKKAWDEWLKSGFLVPTEKGFKLCPNTTK